MEKLNTFFRSTAFQLLALMVGSALLSYFLFNGQSLRLDEAQSLWQTSRSPVAILSIVAKDVHVPLYHMMLHYWLAFFGTSISTARILSLIFYILTIPAIYLLGKKVYNHKIAMFAAFLTACSPFLTWYGSEARMYSLLTLVAVLNQLAFLSILKDRKQSSWVGYFFSSLLGMFTHYLFFTQLLVQAIYLIVKRRKVRRKTGWTFVGMYSVLAALFLPWVLFVIHLGSASGTRPLLETPTTVNVFNTFAQFFVGFQVDSLNTAVVSLWPLAVLFIFFALQRNQRMSEETQYFMMASFLPIVIVYLFSLAVEPFYLSRYLIFVIPSFYLAISWLFSTYGKPALYLRIGLFVIMLIALIGQGISVRTPIREDYHAASDYLTQVMTGRDVMVVSAPFTIYPIEYYYHGAASMQTLPIWDRVSGTIPAFNAADLPAMVKQINGDHDRTCLLLSYDQGYEKTIFQYYEKHFQQIKHQVFSPDLSVYCYQLRYDPL